MDTRLLKKRELKKNAAISFEPSTLEKVDELAKRNGVSRSRFVDFACQEAIQSLERKERLK